MILKNQIGVEFNFKTDWKALFQKDTWFMWEQDYMRDRVILRRFNIFNLVAWYYMKLLLKLMVIIVKPIIRANERYWNYPQEEGQTYRYVTDYMIYSNTFNVKFFRMDKKGK